MAGLTISGELEEAEFVNILFSVGNKNVSNSETDEALKNEVEAKPQGKVAQACWRLRAIRRTLTGDVKLLSYIIIHNIHIIVHIEISHLQFDE